MAVCFANAQHSVTLTDGRTLEGKILQIDNDTITIRSGKEVFFCPPSQVTRYFNGTEYIDMRLQTAVLNRSTAGDELIKASNLYYTGLIITAIGTGIMVIYPQLNPDGMNDTQKTLDMKASNRKIAVLTGGAFILAGTIINVSSFAHISLAGKKLNLKMGKDGLGMAMTL